MKTVKDGIKNRYALATRAANIETLIVTGVLSVLMIVWACLKPIGKQYNIFDR